MDGLPQSAVFNASSVSGIPTGDTQSTRDLGTEVPKTRGYPNHCDSATLWNSLPCNIREFDSLNQFYKCFLHHNF